MDETTKRKYCDLLTDKIATMFCVSKELAVNAVNNSAIQKLIREEPEYVDHVPLSSWAEEVYREMFS